MARKIVKAKAENPQSDLITTALKRFREAADAESEIRSEAMVDLEFWAGQQWPADIETARKNEGRPCLTINKLSDLSDKIVNEQALAQTGIEVLPEGSGASVDTAEVLQGLIRNIENQSEAQDVYDESYEIGVVSGAGYYRVTTEYADDESFNQVARIRAIPNRFSVYLDPHSKKKDGSDAKFAFIVEDISHDEYKERYPDAEMASLVKLATSGDAANGWVTKNTIRIAEYWRIEYERKTLKSDDAGAIRSRTVLIPQVKCDTINAVQSLERYDWVGTTIPIVKITIKQLEYDGRKKEWGLVRHARDPQRQYNYQRSAETETIALAPKAPFIVAEGQIEGHEGKWQTANNRNWPYLEYKPSSVNGQMVPAPERNQIEPPVQAISMATQQADADIKSVTGLFEPSLGMQGPEQSARAIVARQGQGALSTMTYSKALARAKKRTGRILLEIIPKIYDAPRVEQIVNPDGTTQHVGLFNSQVSGIKPEDVAEQLQEAQAIKGLYDLGKGHYSVSVQVGQSYQSKRQEAATGMMTLINSYPQIIQFAGDILARNLDWPGSQELAKRLQKMLPPQLQDANDPVAALNGLQQQMSQMQAINQALQQKLEAANDALQAQSVQMEGRKEIAAMQGQVQLAVQEMKSRTAEAQAQTDRLMQLFASMHDSAHEVGMQAIPPQAPANPTGGIPPGTNPQ
ncbi:MAG: hypothetical protein KGL39_14155 [Patescibacteria group bacterium]|nr:hypothetical protein [Patescibacteria group bacterium]